MHALLRAAHIRRNTEKYYEWKFHHNINGGTEFTSLNEFLGLNSGFDSETDQALDDYAKRRLEEEKAMRNV